MKEKKSVRDIVTERIINALKGGVVPWHKPWKGGISGMPKSYVSKKEYRGMNIWLLMCSGFTCPYWVTYKQCTDRGGNVKKGEHGTLITFWSRITRKDKETGEESQSFILRYYLVFNYEQTEGLKEPKDSKAEDEKELDFVPIDECEKVVAGYSTCPEIKHGGGRAYYSPDQDYVQVPEKKNFKGVEEYYSTLFHELVHSTGHEKRNNRDLKNWFGSDPYAKEELVAEMGACFLNAICGVDGVTFDNSTAYIQSWIKRFEDDSNLIISASSQAQKACDCILGKKWEDNSEDNTATQ